MDDLEYPMDQTKIPQVKLSQSGGRVPPAGVSQYQDARLKRVLAYQANVLTKEDHLGAVLGTVNAGLMSVAIHMDELIEQALAATPKKFDRVQKLLPVIQTYLQATRQIDRLAQAEVRVATARKGKSADHGGRAAKPR